MYGDFSSAKVMPGLLTHWPVLNKIAFEYYPLDLNEASNPFLVSWWPFALGDPALFHVSLQTACLDEELLAQKGFQASEILMADSVALLRRKIDNTSLAVQDGTMNSIITLAAIEFGKGNVRTSQMHIDGVRKLVDLRGGINAVRQTSPLTARMICWVSMLVSGYPRFSTQDDKGVGDGIPPIAEWQADHQLLDKEVVDIIGCDVDQEVLNVLTRLRRIFQRAELTPIQPTQLHDLTCFIVHRLLPTREGEAMNEQTLITECIRDAILLFMFVTQGPTYYSHTVILDTIIARQMANINLLDSGKCERNSLDVWFVAIGLVAAVESLQYQWWIERATSIALQLGIGSWLEVLCHIKSILWLQTPHGEKSFQIHWDPMLRALSSSQTLQLSLQ
ncbi:hypothetical protein HJFPF1_10058 [Paramyrothecium foliicola]|nr:hypothetical protein HJFPF1_10058 [Paramyrothecium foliicola]